MLVAVFVIFRKRYGPKYTVLCFVTGKCPKADRRARASTVPTSIESGIPRETLPSLDRGSKRSKPRVSTCVTGTNKPRMSSQTSQFSHGRQPAVIDPNRPSAPPRDTHPRTQMETANKEIGNTSCRKPPPAALPSLHKSDLRAATEQLRALAPTSPCSSRFTISTQSSDPLPSIYRMALGSRSHKRNSSSNTNCWSYNHDVRSAVDSEDRVLSLPSPSPMLRNMLRPSPKPQTLQPHVYRQMQQPCDTRECECDVALHILPRSAFAVDDTAVSHFFFKKKKRQLM